jgi:hypothetical protein
MTDTDIALVVIGALLLCIFFAVVLSLSRAKSKPIVVRFRPRVTEQMFPRKNRTKLGVIRETSTEGSL